MHTATIRLIEHWHLMLLRMNLPAQSVSTVFSAILVNQSKKGMFVREIGIHAFFHLRDAVESTLKTYAKSKLLHNSIVTAEQAMETDVVAAAQWVICAGERLIQFDNAVFGQKWSRGLEKETKLWNGEPGFSKAGWDFWAKQFEGGANEEWVSEEVSRVAQNAARVLRGCFSQQSG